MSVIVAASLDVSFITERLAISSAINTKEDVDQLIALGITHVVNMRHDFDDSELLPASTIKYLWLPQDDDFTPRKIENILAGIDFSLAALAEPSLKNKILFHCTMGVNRAPTQCFALLRALGLTKHDADALIRHRRPLVNRGNTFRVYVDSVEAALEKRRAS